MGKRKKRTGRASGYRKSLEGYQREEGNYTRSYAPVSSPFRRNQEELSRGARNFKTYAIYGTLAVGVSAGLVWAIRHFIQKSKKNSSERKSTEAGNPATYAKLLKMAFDNDNMLNWGTDEDLVFNVLTEIPSYSMYVKVQKEYSAQNEGRSLNADLSSELSSSEYQKALDIINSKPDSGR